MVEQGDTSQQGMPGAVPWNSGRVTVQSCWVRGNQ